MAFLHQLTISTDYLILPNIIVVSFHLFTNIEIIGKFCFEQKFLSKTLSPSFVLMTLKIKEQILILFVRQNNKIWVLQKTNCFWSFLSGELIKTFIKLFFNMFWSKEHKNILVSASQKPLRRCQVVRDNFFFFQQVCADSRHLQSPGRL